MKRTPTEALKHLERIETALKDNNFISFTEGYTLGKAVLYIREYLQEKENPQKQPASH